MNAAQLGGADPTAYTTQIDGMTCANAGGCSVPANQLEVTNVMDMTVTYPADGVARVSYSASIADTVTAGSNFIQTWLSLDDTSCGGWFFAPLDDIDGTFMSAQIGGDHDWAPMVSESVFVATAGEHTISLCMLESGSDDASITNGHISSIWSASGSGTSSVTGGLTPTGAAEATINNS